MLKWKHNYKKKVLEEIVTVIGASIFVQPRLDSSGKKVQQLKVHSTPLNL